MDTLSLWHAIQKQTPAYPSLTDYIEVDVAIIGGGITGVTTALRLIEGQKKIAILEAKKIGGMTTSFSTGNLYAPVQPYFQNIVSKFNAAVAKVVAQSRQFAIDYIERNVRDKNLNCQFQRRPWFIYTDNADRVDFLKKEIDTLKQLDLAIDNISDLPLPIPFKKAAALPDQARFNPLAYVLGLADYLKKNDCELYEDTRVLSITEENNTCVLKTERGRVLAKKVVIATHSPIGIHGVQLFIAPYRSYVVAASLNDEELPEGHFWDVEEPHHTSATHALSGNTPNLFLVAGSHHKTGQDKHTESHYESLKSFLTTYFPKADITYHWSAQHFKSADLLPFIGYASRRNKNILMATGYFADGLVYGTLAGLVMGDLILGIDNPCASTFQSTRLTPISSPLFVKENANVFMQYLKDQPMMPLKNFEDIKAGEAKVISKHGEKWAVYREPNNQLHVVSAVCTHMKCIVNWNDAEKTWDCPCHGSRFTIDGDVLEGPAIENLQKKNWQEA